MALYKFGIACVFCLAVTCAAASGGKLTGKQNILLQHAVKNLLGFKDVPGGESGLPHSPENLSSAPKYMLELYEQYRYGSNDRRKPGNTVRSISAQIGVLGGNQMFMFNLSSIDATETVFSGEIHLYRRKSHVETEDYYMDIHEIAPSYASRLDTHRLHGRGHGWHSYDITSSLKSCLSVTGKRSHLLALSFRESDGKEITLKRFIRQSYLPFLIVFSNDTQNITLDHIDPYFNAAALSDGIIDPETGSTVKGKRNKKSKRKPSGSRATKKVRNSQKSDLTNKDSEDDDAFHDDDYSDKEVNLMLGKNIIPEMGFPVSKHRTKRSIHDNEIPQDEVSYSAPYNIPETHPRILQEQQTDNTKKHKASKVPKPSSNSRLIPYPEDYLNRKRRRRKERRERRNRRKKQQKERMLPMPEAWGEKVPVTPKVVAPANGVCGRRKLLVDFADIGWSDWIISPKSFEAHYCAGRCPFPLTKGLRPSNHATIQSLVHAIGIHSEVPAPCCVPDALSSVTLLYFDENRNVVLKNYPAMTVQSCACR